MKKTNHGKEKPIPNTQSTSDKKRLLKRATTAYQILLSASIILNGSLGILAFRDNKQLNELNEQKTRLELAKETLENQILKTSTYATFSIFRLQYELPMLAFQLNTHWSRSTA